MPENNEKLRNGKFSNFMVHALVNKPRVKAVIKIFNIYAFYYHYILFLSGDK